jgi:Domain of unknown function (DUF3854)
MSFQDSGQNAHSSSKKETKETRTIDVPIIAKSSDLANLKKSESGVEPTPNLSFQQTFTTEVAEVLKQPESRGEALQIFKALFAPLPTPEGPLKRFQEFADMNPAAALPLLELKRLQPSTIKASENLDAWFNEREKAITWAGLMGMELDGNHSIFSRVAEALGVDQVALQIAYETFKEQGQAAKAAAEALEVRAILSWGNDPSGRLCDKHREELNNSAIHPGQAALNYDTFCGNLNIRTMLKSKTVRHTWGLRIKGKALTPKGSPTVKKTKGATHQRALVEPALNFKSGDHHTFKESGQIQRYTRPTHCPTGLSIPFVLDFNHYKLTGETREDEGYWPHFQADLTIPLVLPEGEKKRDSIVSATEGKIAGVALSGVTMGGKPGTHGEELREELAQLNLKGRPVFICFDEDKWKVDKDGKQNIRVAELRLADALHQSGAKVRMINLASEDAITRREAAPNFPGNLKLNKETGKFEPRKWGIDDHLACFAEGDRAAELSRLMDESEIFEPDLILEGGETVEECLARIWAFEVEQIEGWVVRYSDGYWYKQVAPRSFKLLANGEADVRVKVQGLLKKLKVRRKVEGEKGAEAEAEVDKEAKAKWEMVKAKTGTTKNINACLPWLKSELHTAFTYDPNHLTFDDGQVMELSTGRLIDGSALPPTIHALPFVYKPTEFDDLPKAVRELLIDRFTPEDLLSARAVLRYAFDRSKDAHGKGYTVQFLAESNGGKSVLMRVITACKPDLTANITNFDKMNGGFFLSTTLGRGQDVLLADEVATIPHNEEFLALISANSRDVEFKNGKLSGSLPQNVAVMFAGTAVVTPLTAGTRGGYETRYIPLRLQPLPHDKVAHKNQIFVPFLDDRHFNDHAYAIICWALGMSRAEMRKVLDAAASNPEKRELLNNETQVGRFRGACLSEMPDKYELDGDRLCFEGVGLKLLSENSRDETKVLVKRVLEEGGVAESDLYPMYVAWAKTEGIKNPLQKGRFLESFRELEKGRLKLLKGKKVYAGGTEKKLRDSYGGLWWASGCIFAASHPSLFPEAEDLYDDDQQIRVELLNSI